MSVTCLDTVAVVDDNLVAVASVAELDKLNSTAVGSENELTRGVAARNIKTCVEAASAVAVVRGDCIKSRNGPYKFAL